MSALQKSLSSSPPRSTSAPPSPLSSVRAVSSPVNGSSIPTRPSPLGNPATGHIRSVSQSNNAVPSSSQLPQDPRTKDVKGKRKVLGIQERLKAEIDGVVKRRVGSVLARGLVCFSPLLVS